MKTKTKERHRTGPIVEVDVEYTDQEILELFGDDPDCLVMALLKRAQAAESKLAEYCLPQKGQE